MRRPYCLVKEITRLVNTYGLDTDFGKHIIHCCIATYLRETGEI